jgi:hypothetical protein
MELQENSVNPPNRESCDVFHENESRSALANEADELKYKPASLTLQARSSPRSADVLAWETPGDEIHRGQVSPSQRPHIIPNGGRVKFSSGHAGQEHSLSVGLDFTVSDGSHPWAECEADPADSRK